MKHRKGRSKVYCIVQFLLNSKYSPATNTLIIKKILVVCDLRVWQFLIYFVVLYCQDIDNTTWVSFDIKLTRQGLRTLVDIAKARLWERLLTSRGLPSDSTCVLKTGSGKLDIKRCVLSLPGKTLRTLLTSRGLPSDSTCLLKTEPGKLDIKRREPGILSISLQADSQFKLAIMTYL